MGKIILALILFSLANHGWKLSAEEKLEKTPKLKELSPLTDTTPTLEKTELHFQNNLRKGNLPKAKKKNKDSTKGAHTVKEPTSPRKGKEPGIIKEPPKPPEL